MSSLYYVESAVLLPQNETMQGVLFTFAIGNKEAILSHFPTYSEVVDYTQIFSTKGALVSHNKEMIQEVADTTLIPTNQKVLQEAIKKSLTDTQISDFLPYWESLIIGTTDQGFFIDASSIQIIERNILNLSFKEIIKIVGKKNHN